MIRIKRVYNEASFSDGVRILVDRVWPRGVSKERARVVAWQKEVAPSTPLRKWFGHDPAKWEEFRRRYRAELRRPAQAKIVHQLAEQARSKTITLLYGAADQEHNQAVVLKDFLEEQDDRRQNIGVQRRRRGVKRTESMAEHGHRSSAELRTE